MHRHARLARDGSRGHRMRRGTWASSPGSGAASRCGWDHPDHRCVPGHRRRDRQAVGADGPRGRRGARRRAGRRDGVPCPASARTGCCRAGASPDDPMAAPAAVRDVARETRRVQRSRREPRARLEPGPAPRPGAPKEPRRQAPRRARQAAGPGRGAGMPPVGRPVGLSVGLSAGLPAGTAGASTGAAGVAACTGDSWSAALPAGLAGAFLAVLAAALAGGALSSSPKVSVNRFTTGGSTVDDADLTNSPISLSLVRTTLLSTPSSLASSWTRTLATLLLLVRARFLEWSRGRSDR